MTKNGGYYKNGIQHRTTYCDLAGESPKLSRKRDGRNTSEGVWRRLGLQRPSKHTQSCLTPLSYVARCVGGKAEFMRLARLSSDPLIRGLVSRWDSLSRSDKRYVSLEDLCEAFGLDAAELFGAVVAACHANGFDTARLVWLCDAHLSVVEAIIKGGLKADGNGKRERLLRIINLL
jgi:hypothetical protein